MTPNEVNQSIQDFTKMLLSEMFPYLVAIVVIAIVGAIVAGLLLRAKDTISRKIRDKIRSKGKSE